MYNRPCFFPTHGRPQPGGQVVYDYILRLEDDIAQGSVDNAAAFKALVSDMVARGVQIKENLGYVSRSDDVACVEVSPNILLLSYPVKNPHFNKAVPSASIRDILNLAKAICWMAIHMGKSA